MTVTLTEHSQATGEIRGKAAIAQVDFAAIRRRLIISAAFEDWRADRAIALYRTFLEMCVDHPEREIAPPRDADIAWHYHILDTRTYPVDCRRIFGHVLHHDPDVHGSPRFWAAWDLARDEFRRRMDVDLPYRETVTMEPGLVPETCSVVPGHTGLAPETCSAIRAADSGLGPETCSVVPGDNGLRPETCSVVPGDRGLQPETCSVVPGTRIT